MKLKESTVFFLEHQQQIESWASLREDATAAANRFFDSLSEKLLQAQWPSGVRCRFVKDDLYPKFFLVRDDWIAEADGAESLRAGIGLEWHRTSVDFRSAYVGVWVDPYGVDGQTLRSRIAARLDPSTAKVRKGALDYWIVQLPVVPPPRYWERLQDLETSIARAIRELWRVHHSVVDAAFLGQN